MAIFRLDTTLAKVKRLWYTADGAFEKGVWNYTDEEKKGYFLPQSENAVDQGFWRFGVVFRFECNAPFDVQEGDRLEINWKIYDVKATEPFKWITIHRVHCILVRSKNE